MHHGRAASAVVTAAWITFATAADPPALTVYNQQFAVVREALRLDLKPGVNELTFSELTAHLEPDSVILRDPQGRRQIRILEQNFRNDPISQDLLLSVFEGKTIEFQIDKDTIVPGRIVRSGYAPHTEAWNRYGQQYWQRQAAISSAGGEQPIIELDGKLRFGLPGTPIFPSLADDSILKPTLQWSLESDEPGPLDAELAYVTGGMSWVADYNVLAPPTGDRIELIGWVTIENQSGRTFENARIKLMAGDVTKLAPEYGPFSRARSAGLGYVGGNIPAVTEKSFDEYHLYSIARPATLRDRQTKQIEFIRAGGIDSRRVYVYEGARIDAERYAGWDTRALLQDPSYGSDSNPKVWVMRECCNSADNGLGMPLPAGRVRFYRQDDDRRLEFIGENEIDHTPKDELVRIYTGNAFDLTGERRQISFNIDHGHRWVDESFQLKLRNHKSERVEIRVVERLYRWHNWEIRQSTHEFSTLDARTIEYRVPLKPDEEATISYGVHYSW